MSYAISTTNYRPGPEIDRVTIPSERPRDEDIETLIDDTIGMIENTRNFLSSMDAADAPMHEYMREASLRLERSLEALRRRREELRSRERLSGI